MPQPARLPMLSVGVLLLFVSVSKLWPLMSGEVADAALPQGLLWSMAIGEGLLGAGACVVGGRRVAWLVVCLGLGLLGAMAIMTTSNMDASDCGCLGHLDVGLGGHVIIALTFVVVPACDLVLDRSRLPVHS